MQWQRGAAPSDHGSLHPSNKSPSTRIGLVRRGPTLFLEGSAETITCTPRIDTQPFIHVT